MKKICSLLVLLMSLFVASSFAHPSSSAPAMPEDALTLQSPDHQLELQFAVVNGVPQYALNRAGKPVVLPSRMGFILEWRDDLAHAFVLKGKSAIIPYISFMPKLLTVCLHCSLSEIS